MCKTFTLVLFGLLCWPIIVSAQYQIDGELKQWHKTTLTFDGPQSSEQGDPNPFADYRLDVTFSNGDKSYVVPGYFAADGDAANTGATSGTKWRVHFSPDNTGTWDFTVSFRQGTDVAISDDPMAGSAISFDGLTGQFDIAPSDKAASDPRSKGRLEYVGEKFLKYAGSGEYFVKVGTNSPENLLAYEDFDNTPDYKNYLKSWAPHVKDWKDGDPTWGNGLGKGIIGAANYLVEQGQNVFTFITMTIEGDDRNVFPFVNKNADVYDRYDCSKLDQWEILFEHADNIGLMQHFILQETENDKLLDGGNLGRTRTLYFRELIARYSHHLALKWNMGEENNNSRDQRIAYANYFYETDPYQHHIVIHTSTSQVDEVYGQLDGDQSYYSGTSLQVTYDKVHQKTLDLLASTQAAGKPWTVANDETGPPNIGVPEDHISTSPSQLDIRSWVLWGNLMAGGAGVEYYFGYNMDQSDLTLQDFSVYANMWKFNRIAQHFFTTYLPFQDMENRNDLIGNLDNQNGKFCLADPGRVYAIYHRSAKNTINLELEVGTGTLIYQVYWYNPREGGELQRGTIKSFASLQKNVNIGYPPTDTDKDWVALVTAGTQNCPPPGSICDTTNPDDTQYCFCINKPTVDRPITPPQPVEYSQWIEAECANQAGATWTVENKDEASNGKAMYVAAQTDYMNNPSGDEKDNISYSFSVPASGAYRLYARTVTLDSDHDSYWVRVDDGPWLAWNEINHGSYGSNFQWDYLSHSLSEGQSISPLLLRQGDHKVTFSVREGDIWLDKILISNARTTPSGQGGNAPECSDSCPAAGTPCDDGDPDTEDDVEDGNCNCEGTPIDVCPAAGTPCDDGDPDTENDVEDGNCNCEGTPIPDPEGDMDFWNEAECVTSIGSTWKSVDEEEGSEGKVLRVPPNQVFLDQPTEENRHEIHLTFNNTSTGPLYIFVRTLTKGPSHDSFWFRIDDGPWALWDNVNDGNYSNDYQWDTLEGNTLDGDQPVSFQLGLGNHTLVLSIREDDIWADKFHISSVNELPTGTGDPAPCPANSFFASSQVMDLYHDPAEKVEELLIYPNPASDRITVSYYLAMTTEPEAGELRLMDIHGKLISTHYVPPLPNGQIELDLYGLPEGIYMVLFKKKGSYLRKLFVKTE